MDFSNTKIAFQYKNNYQLKKAYQLFKLMSNNFLVNIGGAFANLALKINLPIQPIIRHTIFDQFCGGETVVDCENRINKLSNYSIGTILDYSVEGVGSDNSFDATVSEIIKTIDAASVSKDIPFSVFKLTGLASYSILKSANLKIDHLSTSEKEEYQLLIDRVTRICSHAAKQKVKIFIDAEDSWYQGTIDRIAELMMLKYNKNEVIVYTTIQFYRWDRLSYLKNLYLTSEKQDFKLGIKLVRGAYMEKERAEAIKNNYPDPIQKNKKRTDADFNKGIDFCVDHLTRISICLGTHNEFSCLYLLKLMNEKSINKNDDRIFFAQLLGMSDHISFNLSNEGYNVAKYVPYGPIKEVMPYLIRRAEENTSVAGQTLRELNLIKKEIKRRKLILK